MSAKERLVKLASKVSDFYKAHVFWRKIERALALHRRGEARSDGLQMTSAKTTLSIEWIARSVHPWDRDLRGDRAERVFTQQCLLDTNAALDRLFAEIPVLDAIEVRVRRYPSNRPLLSGTVRRELLNDDNYLSPGMRLRAIGLNFSMTNFCLDEMDNQ